MLLAACARAAPRFTVTTRLKIVVSPGFESGSRRGEPRSRPTASGACRAETVNGYSIWCLGTGSGDVRVPVRPRSWLRCRAMVAAAREAAVTLAAYSATMPPAIEADLTPSLAFWSLRGTCSCSRAPECRPTRGSRTIAGRTGRGGSRRCSTTSSSVRRACAVAIGLVPSWAGDASRRCRQMPATTRSLGCRVSARSAR
jgi:hypothetical protein